MNQKQNIVTERHLQTLNHYMVCALAITTLISPLFTVGLILLYLGYGLPRKQLGRYIYIIIATSLALFALVWELGDNVTLYNKSIELVTYVSNIILSLIGSRSVTVSDVLIRWAILPTPLKVLLPCAEMAIVSAMALPLIWRADERMLQRAKTKAKMTVHTDVTPILEDEESHILVEGVTGSGKSTIIQKHIEHYLAKGLPVLICSGKRSTEDEKSFLTALRRLCAHYHRPLHIVSCDTSIQDRVPYNVFDGMSETQIADILAVASIFSDEYYENHFRLWIKAEVMVMRLCGIELSLESIIDCWDWDQYEAMLNALQTSKKIDDDTYKQLLKIKDSYIEAKQSKSRYAQYLIGQERSILCGDNAINARKVKAEKGVLYIDLDSQKYEKFTRILGIFFTADINMCISEERNNSARKLIVMDEIQTFASDMIKGMYSQARGFGYQIISASQGFRELLEVSEVFCDTLISNTNMLECFRLNNSADRDIAAAFGGTKRTAITTEKSLDTELDAAGNIKIGYEYKVNPSAIDHLPDRQFFAINKRQQFIRQYEVSWIPLWKQRQNQQSKK